MELILLCPVPFFNRAVANETGAFFFLINGKIMHKLFKTTIWFISSYEYSETKGCQNQTDRKKLKQWKVALKDSKLLAFKKCFFFQQLQSD